MAKTNQQLEAEHRESARQIQKLLALLRAPVEKMRAVLKLRRQRAELNPLARMATQARMRKRQRYTVQELRASHDKVQQQLEKRQCTKQ